MDLSILEGMTFVSARVTCWNKKNACLVFEDSKKMRYLDIESPLKIDFEIIELEEERQIVKSVTDSENSENGLIEVILEMYSGDKICVTTKSATYREF